MSVKTLGMPAEVRHRLEYKLPKQSGRYVAIVKVSPRDSEEGRCGAWAADHYVVSAFYVTGDHPSLDRLEEAMKAQPGVCMTTQVRPREAYPGDRENVFTNEEWPAALGTARRDRHSMRAQVIAIMRDEDPA